MVKKFSTMQFGMENSSDLKRHRSLVITQQTVNKKYQQTGDNYHRQFSAHSLLSNMDMWRLEKLRLDYEEGFKETIFSQLISPDKKLPVSGSWGYSEDRPIVIDKNHAEVNPKLPFDYVGLEHWIVQKRVEQEMIVYRTRGSEPIKTKCYFKEAKLIKKNNKLFDHLRFAFFGMHKQFDVIYRYNPEYWFDITSCYDASGMKLFPFSSFHPVS